MRFLSYLKRPLLVLLLLGSGLLAEAAELVRTRIYSREREVFQLLIDGHPVGPMSSDFRLPALPAGYHWLEFRFPGRRLPDRVTGFRVQAWFAPGFESVYELDAFPPRQRMSLVRVSCTALNNYYPDPRQLGWYEQAPDPGYDATYGPGYGGYNPGYDGGAQGYAPDGFQCADLLRSLDVNALITSIQSKDFESTKMSIAKQAVGSATILADDVARIMRTFDYESSRLDFAKFAYARCCDQRNYFKVNDAFEFESSVTDLQRFTQGGR